MNVHDTDNDATEPTTHVDPPVAVNVTEPPVSPTVAFTVGVVFVRGECFVGDHFHGDRDVYI